MTTIHQPGFNHTGPRRAGRFIQANPSLQRPDPLKFLPLWPHQARFLEELWDELYWFVVGPPAAGKSLTVAALLTHKLDRDLTLRAIIAVPQTIIGNGFEDCRFQMPGYPEAKRDISFTPHKKLHKPSHGSNAGQVKKFLTRSLTSPVNDRVLICTHQTLVASYKKFPELFQDVLVVIDEAHHSKAEETREGDVLANELGRVVLGLVEAEQQVGLATATVARADGCGLLGAHQDKFKVAECPFDKYLEVCHDFKQFDFGFTLYDQDAWEPINELLGDKRKRVTCTIAHIPHVNSSCSRGKRRDQLQVYRGIAGQPTGRLKIKNPDGDVTGITEIQRGCHTVRVVDLVNTKNSNLKQQVIQQAHDDPDNSRIDVILALRKFIEGANWRWAQNSLILGHRGSFTEMAQLVGRGLRDAPGKQSCSIHYILHQRGTAPDGTPEILNDYLKALLFVLLLEDVFKPVKIRARDPKTGKRRTVKTCLLTEALNHDLTEKFRIEELVVEELSGDVNHTDKTAVKVVAKLLDQEQVQHPWASTNDIARQIIKSYRRRSKSLQATERLRLATDGSDVKDVDVTLVEESSHPLAWLTYFTREIGISTLAGLRAKLQGCLKQRWWAAHALLRAFVAAFNRIPIGEEEYRGALLGRWCALQRRAHKGTGLWRLSAAREKALVAVDGWTWDYWDTRWNDHVLVLEKYVSTFSKLPKGKDHYCTLSLGAWCSRQRGQYKNNRLTVDQISRLEAIPGWYWNKSMQINRTRLHALGVFVTARRCLPNQHSTSSAERSLGLWCAAQRIKYRRGTLNAEVWNALTDVPGWFWERHDRASEQWLPLLIEYVDLFNRIPTIREKFRGTSIGGWCNHQREDYKNNRLTKDRIKKLEQICGWTWRTRKSRWAATVAEVGHWFRTYGASPRPDSYTENQKEHTLGNWCTNQRSRYRGVNPSKLTEGQIKDLEKIPGWWWDRKDKPKPAPLTRYTTTNKLQARHDTIVNLYRSTFGRKSLPKAKQYWSMSARCVDGAGELLPGSELHQLLETKLIHPWQFHGVDNDEGIWEANGLYGDANWYCNDFYDALSWSVDHDPEFNPGIVNVDTTAEPQRGVDLFCRILERLKGVQGCLFIGNFMLHNRGRHYDPEDLIRTIHKNSDYKSVGSTLEWNPEQLLYRYDGATANSTVMCSIMLYRK